MPDDHGLRRAPSATVTGSSQPLEPSAGAGGLCPQCGSAYRPGQEWCTLCLHVLRPAPKPAPVLAPAPVAQPVLPVPHPAATPAPRPAAPSPTSPTSPTSATASPASTTEVDAGAAARRAQAEEAATLLLAQLANDPSNNALPVPPFLRSKSGMAVLAAGGAVVVLGLALLAMTVLGALTR